MKKTFKCSCGTHLLEIEYSNTRIQYKENTPELWIGIYDTHNPNTGRKYKKPKLTSDVWFMMAQPYTKEMESLMKFLENILTKWYCRSNK